MIRIVLPRLIASFILCLLVAGVLFPTINRIATRAPNEKEVYLATQAQRYDRIATPAVSNSKKIILGFLIPIFFCGLLLFLYELMVFFISKLFAQPGGPADAGTISPRR